MRKRFALGILLILLILPVLAQSAFIGVASGESGNILTPKYLWQEQFGYPSGTVYDDRQWSSPTVVDGVVYVGATTFINCYPFWINPPPTDPDWWSDFYALNASNGDVIWDYKDDSQLIMGSCVVADGLVFFSAGEGIDYDDVNSLKALNATTGDLVWNYTAVGEISSPVVNEKTVYVNFGVLDKILYAFNVADGSKMWEASEFGATLPAVSNGILYVGSMFNGPNEKGEFIPSYAMNALDANSGRFLWNYTTGYWVSTPTVLNGAVFFCADKDLYALNAATGAKLWNYTIESGGELHAELCSPTAINGVVYVFSPNERGLIALKAYSGTKLWTCRDAFAVPPIVVNGAVYADVSGSISALNAYNGHTIWNSKLSANDLNSIPSKSSAIDENAMYFDFGTDVFSALQLPDYSHRSSLPTIMRALTDEGQTVDISLSGNITSSEISNVYLTTDQNTTSAYLYFTVTGVSHSTGFCNMTLSKNLIYEGTAPIIYIDDKKAENQGYSQDETNYYVWYTTGFSRHQISIIFNVPQNVKFVIHRFGRVGAGVTLIVLLAAVIGLFAYFKKRKS